MDDFYDDSGIVVPYEGPTISVPDYKGAIAALAENARRLHAGACDRPRTRRLLMDYLEVCDTIPYASSYSILQGVAQALVWHALAIPRGALLSDNPLWPALVLTRQVELAQRGCSECAGNYWDDQNYVYSCGGQVRVIDYFGCTQMKSHFAHPKGIVSAHYERCVCGRWFRRLTVF